MGFLLHAMEEVMSLEIRYSGELMVAPLILANNVTHSWIKHVWITTQEYRVNLQTDIANINPQRQGDIKLMRLFVQMGWKQPELQMLNQCCMYLKVFHVSDIVIGSGTLIAVQYWDQTQPAESSMDWSQTSQPSAKSWLIWHQALTSVLHLGRNQSLASPLSKWHVQTKPQGWYYHSITNSLSEINSTDWIHHGCLPQ